MLLQNAFITAADTDDTVVVLAANPFKASTKAHAELWARDIHKRFLEETVAILLSSVHNRGGHGKTETHIIRLKRTHILLCAFFTKQS